MRSKSATSSSVENRFLFLNLNKAYSALIALICAIFCFEPSASASIGFYEGFEIKDDSGTLMRRFHNEQLASCVPKSDSSKRRVLIAEIFGIDITHPLLSGRVLADTQSLNQCAGSYLTNEGQWVPHRLDLRFFEREHIWDVDHGTQVATIAMQKLNQTGFYPLAGDPRQAEWYHQMGQLIDSYQIDVVNLSMWFRIQDGGRLHLTDPLDLFQEAREALRQLLVSRPATLFVIAAGNGRHNWLSSHAINLSAPGNRHYPVGFEGDNLLKVGALATAELKAEDLVSYEMAPWSNYSIQWVDILAPGQNLNGGLTGGGMQDNATGTSFATPYLVNRLMEVAEQAPEVSDLTLKEIALKTAFIPSVRSALGRPLNWRGQYSEQDRQEKLWYPVRSGGIYFHERVKAVVELLQQEQQMAVDEAIELILTNPANGVLYDHEFHLRRQLWEERKLSSSALLELSKI